MAKFGDRLNRLEGKEREFSLVIYGDANRGIKGLLSVCKEYEKIIDEHTKYFHWVVGGSFVVSVVWAMFVVYMKFFKGVL